MRKEAEKHISLVKAGDTIVCSDGLERTVCNSNIKRGFCGISIFGDSWKLNTQKVKAVSYR